MPVMMCTTGRNLLASMNDALYDLNQPIFMIGISPLRACRYGGSGIAMFPARSGGSRPSETAHQE